MKMNKVFAVVLLCRSMEGVESENDDGLCSCIGTVVAAGRHSCSCRYRIQTVCSLDCNIGGMAKHNNANTKANKSRLV